jgi:hypothetical protein
MTEPPSAVSRIGAQFGQPTTSTTLDSASASEPEPRFMRRMSAWLIPRMRTSRPHLGALGRARRDARSRRAVPWSLFTRAEGSIFPARHLVMRGRPGHRGSWARIVTGINFATDTTLSPLSDVCSRALVTGHLARVALLVHSGRR